MCHVCGRPKTDPSKVFPRNAYDCEKCGFPTHCSKDCHAKDIAHLASCDALLEMNNDYQYLLDPDIQKPTEHPKPPTERPSLQDWDSFFTTRGFDKVANPHDHPTMRRIWSQIFTYPITLCWVMRQLGLPGPIQKTMTITFLGANRVEATLPQYVWQELNYQFPEVSFDVWLVGPEIPDSFKDVKVTVSDRLTLHYKQTKYHEARRRKARLLEHMPTPDMYMFFNSGIGYTGGEAHWDNTLTMLLPKSVHTPLVFTSLDVPDQERDAALLKKKTSDNGLPSKWRLPPRSNPFGSLRKNMHFQKDINHVFAANHTIMAL